MTGVARMALTMVVDGGAVQVEIPTQDEVIQAARQILRQHAHDAFSGESTTQIVSEIREAIPLKMLSLEIPGLTRGVIAEAWVALVGGERSDEQESASAE